MVCIDSPTYYNWTPFGYAWAGSAAIVIGALTARTNGRVGFPLLVLGVALLGFALAGPPYKSCAEFQIFRPQ